MAADAAGDVTLLLRRVADGDTEARARLAELVYRELRTMAARQLRGMQGATLQPTALVHEAWLKLAGSFDFDNRRHFLGVAGKAMRSVLVDHVRRKRAQKRGGGGDRPCELDDAVAFLEAGEVDLLDLDAALAALEVVDAMLVTVVEMRFFSGMTNAEIAAVQGCSESTIERAWRVARAWLRQRLDDGEAS